MLKKLTPRHKGVMRRLILQETPQEIAEELGLHPDTINKWMKDPLFGSALSELDYEMRTSILSADGRVEALEVINHSMKDAAVLARDTMGDTNVDRNLRMKSAWDILDRGGLKPTDKKLVGHVNLTDLIMEAAKQRKAEQENGKVIEAEALRDEGVTEIGGRQ